MSKGKILIADDTDAFKEFMVQKAQKAGYETEAFPNGQLLLNRYIELSAIGSHPVAIVSDNNMPVLGGIELAAEIRKLNKAIPFILVSAMNIEKAILTPLDICFLSKDILMKNPEKNVVGNMLDTLVSQPLPTFQAVRA